MCFRCFKHVSLHVYYRVWSWNNFENRSKFGEVMGKSSVPFFDSRNVKWETEKSQNVIFHSLVQKPPKDIFYHIWNAGYNHSGHNQPCHILAIDWRVSILFCRGGGVRIRQLPLTWSGAVNTVLGFGTAADNRKLTCNTDSPSTCPPVSPSVTHSLFHSRLKTNLFHKSFPPQSVSTHRTAFSDNTGPDSFCSTVFIFIYFFIFITGYVVD